MAPPKCVYTKCPSFFNDNENRRYFKLPKDRERSEMWLRAIGRTDLIGPHKIYNRLYKICDLHFTDDMYMNPFEKRTLLDLAFPNQFQAEDHTYSKPCEQKVTELIAPTTNTLQSIDHPPIKITEIVKTEATNLESQTFQTIEVVEPPSEALFNPLYVNVDENMDVENDASTSIPPPPLVQTEKPEPQKPKSTFKQTIHQPILPPFTKSHAQTQTKSGYVNSAPEHIGLKRVTKKLRNEVKKLTAKVAALQQEIDQRPTTYLEFDRMCDQLLPAKLSEIIKGQARLAQATSVAGFRFAPEHIQFAISIYNACGPEGYKHLSQTLILPSKRCLDRFKKANKPETSKTETTE